MLSPELVRNFLLHTKFLAIILAFTIATLLFAHRCKKRSHFGLRATAVALPLVLLSILFAYIYGGSLVLESLFCGILILIMFAGLMFCYQENIWNMVFYFGSGFMTWYITDRLFLIIASLCRINPILRPYFVENTFPHALLYAGCFAAVYLFVYFTAGLRMYRLSGSEIPMQNALLLILLVCILTPIFYFESQVIANYNLLFYNILNFGEIVFYVFMLLIQVLMLVSAKEHTEFHTMQKLWLEEKKQYQLVKENIDALNIKCHDLKHQIRNLRSTGQVDSAYLDDLERSVAVYNSTVRTGNETLDIVLTDKRLHCATHNIQFTCIAEGKKMEFMESMDIVSLFGNILDNAIECESQLPAEMRFIHLSIRSNQQLLLIHVENHFEGTLDMKDGIPITTKENKLYHGYGMLSIQHIVKKYGGDFHISTGDNLFQIDIMLPISVPSSTQKAKASAN